MKTTRLSLLFLALCSLLTLAAAYRQHHTPLFVTALLATSGSLLALFPQPKPKANNN